MGVQGPVRHRQIIRITAMPGEQSRIFLAKDRLTQSLWHSETSRRARALERHLQEERQSD